MCTSAHRFLAQIHVFLLVLRLGPLFHSGFSCKLSLLHDIRSVKAISIGVNLCLFYCAIFSFFKRVLNCSAFSLNSVADSLLKYMFESEFGFCSFILASSVKEIYRASLMLLF